MNFTPGRFNIATSVKNARGRTMFDKFTTTEGYVSACGRFGIAKGGILAKRTDPYTLTHIPTGRAFGGLAFGTLADAKLAATRFAALTSVDWTSTNAKTIATSEARALYQAMRRVPVYRSFYKGLPMGREYADPRAELAPVGTLPQDTP